LVIISKLCCFQVEIFCWTPSSCLYRQHSLSPLIDESTIEFDPDLDRTPLNVEEIRKSLCPRISTRDILKLYDSKLSKLILIDIRSPQEYSQACVINSKNIPFENINFTKLNQLGASQNAINIANENDSTSYLIHILRQNKNLLKIIITSDEKFENAIELANALVRINISKLCILSKGIDCFKSTKIYQSQQE
jgi:rhodanese-related sulfurtransferase